MTENKIEITFFVVANNKGDKFLSQFLSSETGRWTSDLELARKTFVYGEAVGFAATIEGKKTIQCYTINGVVE